MHAFLDLDGTLVDSAPGILASLRFACEAADVLPVVPLDRTLIGPPLPVVLRRVTGLEDAARLATITRAFQSHYDETGFRASQPFPGVPAMLRALHAAPVALHLLTNKRRVPTEQIVDLHGWRSFLDGIHTLDTAGPGVDGKAALLAGILRDAQLDATTTWLVGDTEDDARAAAACGVRFVGVTWGYGRFTTRGEDVGRTYVDTPQDIPAIVCARPRN